jgi:plastocyanin
MSVNPGEDILLCRDSSVMASYFDVCFSEFDYIITGSGSISQNGDDAIELFMDSLVVETFGDINVDGSGECWEYLDSWAFKSLSGDSSCLSGQWIFGGVNCTDGSTTIYDASCLYPICPPAQTAGCTDSTALNYDPSATIDDGSCLYPVLGCIDSLATNYNVLATIDDGSCFYFPVNLSLQGIIDFTVPSGGSDGKAIHLIATDSIADLSVYGIGVANNGGGTDSIEYVFPSMSVSAGEDILLCRDSSAMASYFSSCFNEFEHVIIGSSAISQNGDDAIELYKIFSSSSSPISHTVSSGNYYYTPSNFNINVGDTVTWLNNGGFHNVNFNTSSITGLSYANPESFISSPTSGPVLYTHIFTIPGAYSYDCSVGWHSR